MEAGKISSSSSTNIPSQTRFLPKSNLKLKSLFDTKKEKLNNYIIKNDNIGNINSDYPDDPEEDEPYIHTHIINNDKHMTKSSHNSSDEDQGSKDNDDLNIDNDEHIEHNIGEKYAKHNFIDNPDNTNSNEQDNELNASIVHSLYSNSENEKSIVSVAINSDSNSNINDLIELVEEEEKDKKLLNNFNNSFNSDKEEDNLILKIDDFEIICNLSKGGYGSVDLCRKIKTNEKYAIKTVDISNMVSILI